MYMKGNLRNFKKVILMSLISLICFSFLIHCGDGGDDDNPMGSHPHPSMDEDGDSLAEINTIEDLDAVRNGLEGGEVCGGCTGYELMQDLDFTSSESYADADNMSSYTSGNGWNPIGDNVNAFKTIFEGNGNTISGLFIDASSATPNAGFFAINSGEIRNLILESARIKGEMNVAALIGVNDGEGIVRECEVKDSEITTGTSEAIGNVGGLAAENRGMIQGSRTRGSNISIEGRSDSSRGIGGLVGSNNGMVEASYVDNESTVTGGSGPDRIGGLIGIQNDTEAVARNSYVNDTTVKGEGNTDAVGGLIGTIRSSLIENSYVSNSTVEGGDDSDAGTTEGVGGLVGGNLGRIRNSYGHANKVKGGDGDDYVGGLAGRTSGVVQDCYVSMGSNENNIEGGSGDDRTGGVAGFVKSTTLERCYMTANHEAINGGSGTDEVGGLAGFNEGGMVKQSYWNATSVNGGAGVGQNSGGGATSDIAAWTRDEMQSRVASNYQNWSTNNWNFGTNTQFPALKAQGSGLLCRQPNPRAQCP